MRLPFHLMETTSKMKIVNLRPYDFRVFELPSDREVTSKTLKWSHVCHTFYGASQDFEKEMRQRGFLP